MCLLKYNSLKAFGNQISRIGIRMNYLSLTKPDLYHVRIAGGCQEIHYTQ